MEWLKNPRKDDRTGLRHLLWALLILCVLVDFAVLEWLTFQPDVVPLDSKTFAPPPSALASMTLVGYLTPGGFLLLQAGVVAAALKLREGADSSKGMTIGSSPTRK